MNPDDFRTSTSLTPGPPARLHPHSWPLRRRPRDEPFEAKMARLVAQLEEQQAEARRLDEAIWKNLKELGYGA